MEKTTNLSDGAAAYGRNLEKNVRKKTVSYALITLAAFLAAFCVCIFSGRYYTSPSEVIRVLAWALLDKILWLIELPAKLAGISFHIDNPIPVTWSSQVELVLLSIRLPRVLGVMLTGGGLAISGASYQSVFRNPLVSESILGVSAGACFGAMLGVVLRMSDPMVYASAFFFAGGTVLATYLISRAIRGNQTLILVLTGTVLSSLMSSAYSILRYIAQPISQQLSDFMFWIMGSCSRIDTPKLAVLSVVVLAGFLAIDKQSGNLNVMALGEDQARSLGVHTDRTRGIVIAASTAITAVAVSICGIIGWVGMMIPQIVRMSVGPDNRRLIPLSFFSGGVFLMVIDMIVRVPASGEVPIGVLAAMVGTPFYLLAMIHEKAGWM